MTESEIIQVMETVILCSDQPMPLAELRKLFEAEAVTGDDVRRLLGVLQLDWAEKGLELVCVSGGWRFQSRARIQPFLDRLNPERAPRYSRAVLETLAIIAWRQPVTRGDIEDIRGVTVSSQIIKTLDERGWIEVLGYRDAPGRPALLGTTKQFLNDLGLKALDELPRLEAEDAGIGVVDTQLEGICAAAVEASVPVDVRDAQGGRKASSTDILPAVQAKPPVPDKLEDERIQAAPTQTARAEHSRATQVGPTTGASLLAESVLAQDAITTTPTTFTTSSNTLSDTDLSPRVQIDTEYLKQNDRHKSK